MSDLREKRRKSIKRALQPVAPMVKSWFLDVGLDFINSRKFNVQEEAIIEELSDFYLDRMVELKVQ